MWYATLKIILDISFVLLFGEETFSKFKYKSGEIALQNLLYLLKQKRGEEMIWMPQLYINSESDHRDER